MDLGQIRRHLNQAEKLIARGATLVRRQRYLVTEMGSQGQPSEAAEKLLEIFEGLQATYIAEREYLRAWLAKNAIEPDEPAPPADLRAASSEAVHDNPDPRAVAAALDELVEQAYSMLSDPAAMPGVLTEHQVIDHLLCLFESGGGFEARVKAEQLLRPA